MTGLDAGKRCGRCRCSPPSSADDAHAGELLRQALPGTADLITGMQAPRAALMTIVNAIPDQTVILAPAAAAALCQRILSLLPASAELAVRAYCPRNLVIRLGGLGHPAEALPVTGKP